MYIPRTSLFGLGFLFLKNLNSHIVDSGVIKNHDAAVRSRLDMQAAILAEFIV